MTFQVGHWELEGSGDAQTVRLAGDRGGVPVQEGEGAQECGIAWITLVVHRGRGTDHRGKSLGMRLIRLVAGGRSGSSMKARLRLWVVWGHRERVKSFPVAQAFPLGSRPGLTVTSPTENYDSSSHFLVISPCKRQIGKSNSVPRSCYTRSRFQSLYLFMDLFSQVHLFPGLFVNTIFIPLNPFGSINSFCVLTALISPRKCS